MAIMVIGIDPGKRSGIAAFKGSALVGSWSLKSDHTDPHTKLQALQHALSMLDVPLKRGVAQQRVALCVESQFLGDGGNAGRFASTAKVIKSAGVWEACGRMRGLVILPPVLPASWRAVVGLAGPAKVGDTTREALLSGIVATRFWQTSADEDRNASILIAMYGQMLELGWSGSYAQECPGFEWAVSERSTQLEIKRRANRDKKRGIK